MKLDEAIVVHFDETARVALAAGLGLDWPDAATLPGDAPAARAAALIEAAARAGRAADLLAALAAARPAVPWTELPYPAITLARLHAALCRRHSLDSLRTLCFRLGLDYDDLPGESKAGRARELILALEREGRVGELLLERRGPGRRGAGEQGGRGARRLPAAVASSYLVLVCRSSQLKTWLATSSPFILRLSYGVSVLAVAGLWLLTTFGNYELRMTNYEWGKAVGERLLTPGAFQSMTEMTPSLVDAIETPTVLQSAAELPPSPRATTQTTAALQSTAETTPTPPPCTPAPLLPCAPTPQPPTVLIGDRGANVRRGPGAGYPVVVTLRAGARLELRAISPTGEWYQVRLPGHGSPWIDAGYVTVIGGTGGVPMAWEVTGDELRVTRAEGAASAPEPTRDIALVAWAGASPTPASPYASPPPPPATPMPRPTALPTQTPPRPTAAPTIPPP